MPGVGVVREKERTWFDGMGSKAEWHQEGEECIMVDRKAKRTCLFGVFYREAKRPPFYLAYLTGF